MNTQYRSTIILGRKNSTDAYQYLRESCDLEEKTPSKPERPGSTRAVLLQLGPFKASSESVMLNDSSGNGDGNITLNPDVQMLLHNLGTALFVGKPKWSGPVTAGGAGPTDVTAPSTSVEPAKSNATGAELSNVIAIRSRHRVLPRNLETIRASHALTARELIALNLMGDISRRTLAVRGVPKSRKLKTRKLTADLLPDADPIF